MEATPEIQEIIDRRFEAMKRSDVPALRRCVDDLAAIGTEVADLVKNVTEGMIANILGDLPTSIELLTHARSEFQRLGSIRFASGAALTLGNSIRESGDLNKALELYNEALDGFTQIDEPVGIAMCAVSTSIIYRHQGNYPEAIELLQRTLQYFTDQQDNNGLALIYGNLSGCYLDVGEYELANTYMYKTLDLRSTIDDPIGLAKTYHSLGALSVHLGDDDAGLEWYEKALDLYRTGGDQLTTAMCLTHLSSQYLRRQRYDDAEQALQEAYSLAKKSKALPEVLEVAGQLCDLYGTQGQFDKVDDVLDRHADDWAKSERQYLVSLRIRGELCRERGQYDEALSYFHQVLENHQQAGRRSREANTHGMIKQIAKLKGDFDLYLKHQEAEQQIESEIRSDQLKKKLAVQSKQREIESAQQEAEKHKALLYGALPREIADRMLKGEDVSGDHYDHAAVLFLDIVGFTDLSAEIAANEVVRFLDTVFLECDRICAENGVTKIKTIGDSYMAVAFPSPGAASCEERLATVARAIARHSFATASGRPVQLRIGLHSGPVVAGVIGNERLQYDVWGDTVNVASRMESTCEPGRIHVSEAFATAYQDDLAERAADTGGLAPRGEIDVKGRGAMNTWWLETH